MSLRGPALQALRRTRSASCDGTDGTDGQQKCPSIFIILCGYKKHVHMRKNGRVRTTVMVRFLSYGPNFPCCPLLASGFLSLKIKQILIDKTSVIFRSTLFSFGGFEITTVKGNFGFNLNISVQCYEYTKLLYSGFARKYPKLLGWARPVPAATVIPAPRVMIRY